jgi:large subunit ribosomal protein L15
LVRRMPKRGFTNVNEVVFIPINVSMLERFEAGTEVTVERLRSARLVRGPKAPVKILGKGDLSNKLIVKAQAFSESARRKIEAAGGVCEVVS